LALRALNLYLQVMKLTFKNEFENYCIQNFGEADLAAPLFYRFPIAIRYEIGTCFSYDSQYVRASVCRAFNIFNELFQSNDTIYIVVNSFEHDTDTNDLTGNDISTIKTFIKKFIDECTFLYQPKEDTWSCKRYVIKATVDNVDISRLLEEIVWSDVDGRNNLASGVYFINPRNHIIFYLYDDRGLDIVANKVSTLTRIYEKYNNWILNYDREQIDRLFLT